MIEKAKIVMCLVACKYIFFSNMQINCTNLGTPATILTKKKQKKWEEKYKNNRASILKW